MRIGFVAVCLAITGQAVNISLADSPNALTQSEGKTDSNCEGGTNNQGEFLCGLANWLTTPTFNRGCGGCGGCGGGYGGCGGGCGGCKGPKTPAEAAIAKIGAAEKAAEIMKKAANDEKAAAAPPVPPKA